MASGKPWEDWVETQLWSSSSTGSPSSPSTLATAPTTTSPGERKIKMNGVLDQGDDSEFTLDDTKVTMMAYERYVNLMGGPPTPEQESTAEQLSAMRRRVETLQLSPYADFAVWVPFAKKNLKALKLKTWTMQQDGSFVAKDLPGPPDHTQQLQGLQDGFADAGGDVPQRAPGLRGVHREGDEALRGGMAPDCFRRRQGEVGAAWEAAPQGADGHGFGSSTTGRLECLKALGRTDDDAAAGRALLAGATAPASPHLDGPGNAQNTEVADGSLHGGRSHPDRGGHEGSGEDEERSQKEKTHGRPRGVETATRYLYKLKARWWQRRRKSRRQRKPKVFRMEQWEWPLCWTLAGFSMPSEGAQDPRVHHLRVSGPPKQGLPAEEEEVTDPEPPWTHEPQDGRAGRRGGRKRRPQGDGGGGQEGGGEGEDPIEEVGDTTEEEFKPDLDKLPEGLKTYLRGRVFNYLHHFSGAEDMLGGQLTWHGGEGGVVRLEGGRGPRDRHPLPGSAEEGEGWRLRRLPLRLPLLDVLEGKVQPD